MATPKRKKRLATKVASSKGKSAGQKRKSLSRGNRRISRGY